MEGGGQTNRIQKKKNRGADALVTKKKNKWAQAYGQWGQNQPRKLSYDPSWKKGKRATYHPQEGERPAAVGRARDINHKNNRTALKLQG